MTARSLPETCEKMGRRHAYQRFHGYLSKLTFNRNAQFGRYFDHFVHRVADAGS